MDWQRIKTKTVGGITVEVYLTSEASGSYTFCCDYIAVGKGT